MRLKNLSAGDKFIFQPSDCSEKLDVFIATEIDSTIKIIDFLTGKETTRKLSKDDTVILLNL